jgi:2-octaprenyl-6-methoxyphenol hydroxylase
MTAPVAAAFDVAVVGAGPSGLAAALLMAQSGFAHRLIARRLPADHAPRPARRSTALLERMGVLDARARRGLTMRLVDVTGRLIRAPRSDHAREDRPRLWHQRHQRRHPRRSARPQRTRSRTSIDGLVETVELGERQLARLATTSSAVIEAKLVAAADGRRSRLREAAGIGVQTWTYPQSAHPQPEMRCRMTRSRPSSTAATAPFVLVPLLGSRVSVVSSSSRRGGASRRARRCCARARLERRAHSLLGRFTVDSPRQVYPAVRPDRSAPTAGADRRGRACLPAGRRAGLNLACVVASWPEVAVRRRAGRDIGGPDLPVSTAPAAAT